VSAKAKQAGEARPLDWVGVERTVWTERMLEALENGVKGGATITYAGPTAPFGTLGISAFTIPIAPCSSPREDNHRLESRMRENRTSGSEGGDPG